MKKTTSEIEIVAYPDMSQVEDPLFEQMITNEREYWGYRGYGEYVICSDAKCRALLSIEEVYGIDPNEEHRSLQDLEKNGAKTPNCPECNSQTELFLDPKLFPLLIRGALAKNAFGALLLEQEKVRGHITLMKGARAELLHAMNYRQGYDVEENLMQISKQLGEKNVDQKGMKDAICLNRVGINHSLRGQGLFAPLTQTALDTHPEFGELAIISDTRFDSPLLPLYIAIGFESIQEDRYGNVLVVYKNHKGMRESMTLPKNEFNKRYGKKFKAAKENQRQRGISKKRKHYTGIPLLREILQEENEL